MQSAGRRRTGHGRPGAPSSSEWWDACRDARRASSRKAEPMGRREEVAQGICPRAQKEFWIDLDEGT